MVTTKELCVQLQINRSNAAAGGSGANVMASALMSILVTQNGVPVDDLGPNVIGDGTTEIALPTGWTMIDGFNVAPGGSTVSVTQFLNQGSGIYDLRIVPWLGNPACQWLSGEYIYYVGINVTRTVNRRKVNFQGAALGKLNVL